MTQQDKAVALAEKHGAAVRKYGTDAIVFYTDDQLAAMLSDHRQQIIGELAQQSGVMPPIWVALIYACNKCGYIGLTPEHDNCNYLAAEGPRYTETMMREAIASMQARVEQLEELLVEASEQARHSDYDWPLDLQHRIDAALKGASK